MKSGRRGGRSEVWMTEELKPRIVVLGVGGAGGNAINNMIEANLQGVEFIAANTDAQALARSRATKRIQLGIETTAGLGAGAKPEIGMQSAEETIGEIRDQLAGAHMVFIAAGMGGGTGTGAAPVIARVARELGILTIAVLTKPFSFEGDHRMRLAEQGVERIRDHVDTLIVVPNQNLFRIANDRTTFADAFRLADDVLYSGVRGITDLIVMPGLINLDFADISTVMRNMGTALMGMAEASGEDRALEAARKAIENPLLDDITIRGAKGVVINITGGYDMTLFELDEAANAIRKEVAPDANIILGSAFDPELEGAIRVCVVAAGLDLPGGRRAAPAAAYTVRQPVAAPIAEEDAPVVHRAEPALAEGREPVPAQPDDPADEEKPVIVTASNARAYADNDDALPGVFSDRTEVPEPVSSGRSVPGSGFATLFGFRKPVASDGPDPRSPEDDPPPKAPARRSVVAEAGDSPEPEDFDDLEIPAFLRRSANH
jgi:cell division protein FtsZ